MDEFRLAIRRLAKRPASTLASIATLASAIGAAAVTWSVLSAVLVDPLPVSDPATLVHVSRLVTTGRAAGTLQRGINYQEFKAVRDSGVLPDVAASWGTTIPLFVKSDGTASHFARSSFIDRHFLPTLGIEVVSGRSFDENDDRRGAAPTAILSERYWRRVWNADPHAVGRTITVNGRPVAVIGIAPRGFHGLRLDDPADLFMPFEVIADVTGGNMNYFADTDHKSSPTADVWVIARTEGMPSAEVTARLKPLSPTDTRTPFAAAALVDETIPSGVRAGVTRFSQLLAATVILLVLVGCTSVSMLILLRTAARRNELAMCLALGASWLRLARGIVLEGAVLAIAGALLSMPVSVWLFALLRGFELPGGIALGALDLSLDMRALSAAATAALATVAVLSVLVGAFGFRGSIAASLKGGAGTLSRTHGRHTRTAFVAIQVAAALFLSAGAVLFARSVASALELNAGIDPSRLMSGGGYLGPYGYDAPRTAAFFDEFAARLAVNPAIRSLTFHRSEGGMGGKLPVDGVPQAFGGVVTFRAIDENYFATLGLPISIGRNFTSFDTPGSPPVGIASASLARALGGGGHAVGRRITMPGGARDVVEVVGVVPDVVTSVRSLEPLVLYLPLRQDSSPPNRDFTVRAATDASVARAEIVALFRRLDPDVIPSALPTWQEQIGRQMASQQLGATVMGALGTIAILLTLLGAYVLADSMTATRMREMGIRAALGATRRQLGSIVLLETARLIGLGLLAGLGLSWLGASTVRAFLFQVEPFDPTSLGAVAALILVLSLLVSLRAALRAARVDLSTVLKAE